MGVCLHERGHDVQIQRVAERARLLGAIEHRDRASPWAAATARTPRSRTAGYSRTFKTPTLSPRAVRCVDGLVRGFSARSHEHDHALGLGVADVVEQAVVAAGQRAEVRHHLLDDAPGTRA